MTNNQLNRERLEKIKSWRETYGAGSNVMLPAEEAEELACLALAAMDSDPVILYRQVNPVNGMKTYWAELDPEEFRHLKQHTDENAEFMTLYRHAQPAPVVGADLLHTAASAIEDLLEHADPNTSYYSGVWADVPGKLRAAAPQLPGSELATVPGKWIPVSERMPESNKFVLVSNGVWVGQGLYDDSEHLESDEHWQDEHREFINVLHHPVTHWMPLPAAPQEPKP